MPVSGFSTVVSPNTGNNSKRSSSNPSMAVSPHNCSSPSPTNTYPHHNGQSVEMDCLSVSSKMSSAEQMMSDNDLMDDFSNQLSISPKSTSELKEGTCTSENREMEACLTMFEQWNINRQTEFIEHIIDRMSFHQHEHFYSILLPMLQRDFITALPGMSYVLVKYFFSFVFLLMFFQDKISHIHVLHVVHVYTYIYMYFWLIVL